MISALILKTLFLHMPTMDLNKGEAEDSDYEEEINISQKKIDCMTYLRRQLDVQGDKMPFTIQLLGFDNKYYLGIKVSAFTPALIRDQGFFFTVN